MEQCNADEIDGHHQESATKEPFVDVESADIGQSH